MYGRAEEKMTQKRGRKSSSLISEKSLHGFQTESGNKEEKKKGMTHTNTHIPDS
jgi:hypothetical protein